MKILGIDYGRSKVGLAITEGKLADPLKVIRYKDQDSLVKQIKSEVEKNEIEKIVVGISENQIAKESKEFSTILAKKINIPIENFDETLSTHDANLMSIQSGMKRKKRRQMEDAFAASVMLQSYLDNNNV